MPMWHRKGEQGYVYGMGGIVNKLQKMLQKLKEWLSDD